MKHISSRLAVVLLTFTLLAGCSEAPVDSGISAPAAVAFTDALDRGLAIEPPHRVAALLGSFAGIWLLAGGEDTLAAATDDAWDSSGPEPGENVTNLGTSHEISLEVLLAAEPDLVLASASLQSHLELKDTLGQAGIPVAYFDVQAMDDYLDMLELCTRLTGRAGNYELYGARVQEQARAALARVDGSEPTVLCLRVTGASVKVKGSDGTVLGEMLSALGCVNVADGDGSSLLDDLSLEAVMAADPDYIFAVPMGGQAKAQTNLEESLLSNPAWQSLRAVREGRFYILDNTLYHQKPNERWGDAYEGLADILYPN